MVGILSPLMRQKSIEFIKKVKQEKPPPLKIEMDNTPLKSTQDFKFLHERMHQRRLVALRDAQKQALIVRKKRANIATRYTRTGRQAADVEEAVSRNEVLQGYVAEWMQKRGMDYTPNTW